MTQQPFMNPELVRRFESDASMSFLARVTRALSILPADMHEAAAEVAHLAVPTLGDWCIIELLDAETRRVIVAHADPEKDAYGERLAQMSASERDRAIDAHARICVPLTASGRPIGTLLLLSADPRRAFGPDLLGAAESFAAIAALALNNVRLRGEAAEAERSRTRFIGSVVHDLRTPLHVVMGYADLLHAGIPEALPERARGQVEQIRRAAGHLLELVEQVLSFSKLAAAVETVTPAPLELDTLARELIVLLEPLARSKGLTFTAHVPESVSAVITDAGKLRQILYNLLSNAIKFTEHGGVRLTVRGDGDKVILEVSDSGRGIAAQDLAKIFEAFWRADAREVDARRSEGTGLGLHICQRLVRLLGGEISALSILGEGTTMKVTLPLRLRQPESSGEGNESVAPSS